MLQFHSLRISMTLCHYYFHNHEQDLALRVLRKQSATSKRTERRRHINYYGFLLGQPHSNFSDALQSTFVQTSELSQPAIHLSGIALLV